MDVTDQILQSHLIIGGSDNTAAHSLSPSRSLNYAQGPSMQRPIDERVTVLPRRLHYQDSVGLFGAENVFVRVKLDIKDTGNLCFEEPYWLCLRITGGDFDLVETYYTAVFDYNKDLTTVETYEPAVLTNKLASIHDPVVGINLSNLKTGNQFIDKWLDIRLYSRSRFEHPYDLMYVRPNDYFYIGFHARNTRRLPYDVECMIGIDYASRDDVDPRYLAKVI